MRIVRVKIENYRNLEHIDIELDSIVVLIGENNSGKSNFLRALSIPLTSDDAGNTKRLSWYDINKKAKNQYYDFLANNRDSIINGAISIEKFMSFVPTVSIQIYLKPEDNEHYNVNDILVKDDEWYGGITYHFCINKPEELLDRVRAILKNEEGNDNIKMSLLPMELYDYSLTVPGRGSKILYDTLSKFRSVELPVERDGFATSADRLGSKALSDLMKNRMTSESQVRIEKSYREFFDTIKDEGKLDSVLNWQDYSEIDNAQEFFKRISILPNMPQMSSILGSVRLGYDDENMFMQGLGHRNMVLLTVLLNSYIHKERDISFRLMTIEEPEAHLCVSNNLLMVSLINLFSKNNKYTQIVYSTHNVEFVNKVGLDKVVVLHNGEAISLKTALTDTERDYLAVNQNTDIFKILYSKKTIMIEGITEELLVKAYLQTRSDINDIKVISFHKGFTKIIDIWKKINAGSGNKLAIVRDYDDEPRAQTEHEKREEGGVIVRTTKGYTLETDITNYNYDLLKTKYGEIYGWSNMTADQLQDNWRSKKTDVMLRICHDLVAGELEGFIMPPHIQEIIDYMQGAACEG